MRELILVAIAFLIVVLAIAIFVALGDPQRRDRRRARRQPRY